MDHRQLIEMTLEQPKDPCQRIDTCIQELEHEKICQAIQEHFQKGSYVISKGEYDLPDLTRMCLPVKIDSRSCGIKKIWMMFICADGVMINRSG